MALLPAGIQSSAPAVFVSQAPSQGMTQPSPNIKEDELKIGMNILGKKRTKTWHRGTLVAINPIGVFFSPSFFKLVRKHLLGFPVFFTFFNYFFCLWCFCLKSGGGVYKYKVKFDKGKSLLSGNHVAFDYNPTLESLFVGARVVAKYKDGNLVWLYAGIVAEMPNNKNRMRWVLPNLKRPCAGHYLNNCCPCMFCRFLIFFDDGYASYVILPELYPVCRPCKGLFPRF